MSLYSKCTNSFQTVDICCFNNLYVHRLDFDFDYH